MIRRLLALAVVTAPCAAAAGDVSYSIAPLACPPDLVDAFPFILNNTQTIVETSKAGVPSGQVPFLLSTSAAVTLPASPGNTVFWPQAINSAGTMAGSLTPDAAPPPDTYSTYSAALYQDGQYTLLAPPPGSVTEYFRANGINNLGTVVGWDVETDGHKGAVLWTNGEASWIDPNADEASSANAINDRGWIAGATGPASLAYSRPVVWRDGTATNIPLPSDATSGTALAINNAGQVLVTCTGAAGFGDRYLLWDNGAETLLSPLSGDYPTIANSLNGAGVVVGTSGGRAVYWRDGQIGDLNALIAPDSGWTLQMAWDINDAGDIVGVGTYDGIDTPFLLTPTADGSFTLGVPEPATLSLLALAAVPLLLRRSRPAARHRSS